jgi:hypothetical protein
MFDLFGRKQKEEKRKEEVRQFLTNGLHYNYISRIEYDLIWDLTTEGKIHLAMYYMALVCEREA